MKPDDGSEVLVKDAAMLLQGEGLLFIGRPFKNERRGAVRYEAF